MRDILAKKEVRRYRGLTRRTSSIPGATWIQEEWPRESADQLPRRNDRDGTDRFETIDASASLTDLQRTALRWLAFFD